MVDHSDACTAGLMDELQAARRAIAPFLHRTPLVRSRRLSERTGTDLYLKLECLQKTGAFKVRGLLNKVLRLTPPQREAGVVSFSAGNAALGLAYAAAQGGTEATVFVPEGASRNKVAAARDYGAKIVMVDGLAALRARAEALAAETGRTLIHPYDDPELMMGHASLGLELLEDLPDLGTIVTAIGGGGMAGGLALATRASGRQDVRLIGVEPQGADHMRRSLEAGRAVAFAGASVAEGLAPPMAGQHCFDLIQPSFAEVALVSDSEIVAAMIEILTNLKILAEPSGSTAMAGVLSGRIGLDSRRPTVVIVSGGNIDIARLKQLL